MVSKNSAIYYPLGIPKDTRTMTMGRRFIFTLICGMFLGFTLSILTIYASKEESRFPFKLSVSDPHYHSEMEGAVVPNGDVGTHDRDEEFHKMEDHSVANRLAETVRVLCWVMTSPKNHDTKAKHVKATWGKRCNILLFMSSKEDEDLPAVALKVSEGRDYLWEKTKQAYKYAYDHYRDKADWFMKADDDTYVIVENLRHMLQPYSPLQPIYFGCRFKPFIKQGYMSGGAGYVLSRRALDLFVEDALPNAKKCKQEHGGAEDVEIGKCLENVGVVAGDTRDSLGRGRFFPFVPEHHLIPRPKDPKFWYWQYIYYDSKQGMDCCSDSAVSFHYVSANQMYVMEYLIYHLRPYGIAYGTHLLETSDQLKTEDFDDTSISTPVDYQNQISNRPKIKIS